MQQGRAQDVAAPLPFVSAHQGEQVDAHPQPSTGLQEVVPDLLLHEGQALPSPGLPTHEQQPASQQTESLLPGAAPSQPRIPEPGNQLIASPPLRTPAPFAPR